MNWRHIPLLLIATLVTYILHEGAHWAMGEALGYDMWMKINSVGRVSGEYKAEWHAQMVGAAGPLFTVLQGLVAFIVVRKRKAISAFAFLFAAFMMRFAAMLVSIKNPNDEAAVSEWLGLGPWTLHIFVVALLLFLTLQGGKVLELGWKSFGFAYLVMSVAITIIVFSEPYLPVFSLYD